MLNSKLCFPSGLPYFSQFSRATSSVNASAAQRKKASKTHQAREQVFFFKEGRIGKKEIKRAGACVECGRHHAATVGFGDHHEHARRALVADVFVRVKLERLTTANNTSNSTNEAHQRPRYSLNTGPRI
jgi:hypothetical protein